MPLSKRSIIVIASGVVLVCAVPWFIFLSGNAAKLNNRLFPFVVAAFALAAALSPIPACEEVAPFHLGHTLACAVRFSECSLRLFVLRVPRRWFLGARYVLSKSNLTGPEHRSARLAGRRGAGIPRGAGLLCGIGEDQKRAAYGVGWRGDTSPLKGCCAGTAVTVREPVESRAAKGKIPPIRVLYEQPEVSAGELVDS